jgi:hypothetical protein
MHGLFWQCGVSSIPVWHLKATCSSGRNALKDDKEKSLMNFG